MGLAGIEMAKLAHETNKKIKAIETRFNVKITFQGNYKIDRIEPKPKPSYEDDDE